MVNGVCKVCDFGIINILVFRVYDFNKDFRNLKFIVDGLVLDLRGFIYLRYY